MDGVQLEAGLERAHRSREGTLLSEQLEQRIPDRMGRVRRKPMVLCCGAGVPRFVLSSSEKSGVSG